MLKNYLKTSLRNILKNPLSSFINVFGLALAIGTCMVTYTYLSLEFGYEGQHSKRENVFMLTSLVDRDGSSELFGISPGPIGLKLQEDFPQIQNMTRMTSRGVIVKRGINVFRERVRLTDASFIEMFDFNVVRGDLSKLKDRNNIIINTITAKKYFDESDPIGQTLQLRFGNDKKVPMNVVAVVEVSEMNTSYAFDFLANYNILEIVQDEFKPSDWSENISATFIEVADPSQISEITSLANTYRELVNSAQSDWQIEAFSFEPLSTLYERSNDIRSDVSRESDKEGQVVLSIIAAMMLALACLNYLNIAISSGTKRLKEIGVRKVIGANRAKLIVQFITENILLSTIALILGFCLGTFFFIPHLNDLFGIQFEVKVFEFQFLAYIIGMLLLTAIASGAYPAMYISKFEAVSIFKGKLRFGQKNKLTKTFLTLQFVLACITVVAGITFTMNTKWQNEKPWGYDKDNTIMVHVPDLPAFEQLNNRLESNPGITQIASGSHHVGERIISSVVNLPDRKFEVGQMDVSATYTETLGLEIVEGRGFKENYESDRTTVLVNETFAEQLDWDDPLGNTFRFDSTTYEVVGVLKDFHSSNFWSEIYPLFMRVVEEENIRYMVLKTEPQATKQVYEEVQATWAALFPELPFNGNYQKELFQEYFRNVNGHRIIMTTVAVMALLLSCFGLYGLVALNVAGRRKEFSIRKVLGADLFALVKSVSSHFLLFLLIALVLGGPISFFLIGQLMDSIYTFHMPMTSIPVIVAIGFILLSVVVTISSQINRVRSSNPTEGLRIE